METDDGPVNFGLTPRFVPSPRVRRTGISPRRPLRTLRLEISGTPISARNQQGSHSASTGGTNTPIITEVDENDDNLSTPDEPMYYEDVVGGTKVLGRVFEVTERVRHRAVKPTAGNARPSLTSQRQSRVTACTSLDGLPMHFYSNCQDVWKSGDVMHKSLQEQDSSGVSRVAVEQRIGERARIWQKKRDDEGDKVEEQLSNVDEDARDAFQREFLQRAYDALHMNRSHSTASDYGYGSSGGEGFYESQPTDDTQSNSQSPPDTDLDNSGGYASEPFFVNVRNSRPRERHPKCG